MASNGDKMTTNGDKMTTNGDKMTINGDKTTTNGDKLTSNGDKLTTGEVITCRAAILDGPNKPLRIETITVDPPKKGEVRIKMVAAGICQSDNHVLAGHSLEFAIPYDSPIVLGHEGSAVVESVGEGVTSVAAGDHVIPLWLPNCDRCPLCVYNTKTNLCLAGNFDTCWLMDDGSPRLHLAARDVKNFIGTGTFSEYNVLREASVAKVNPKADLKKSALIGCAFGTGYGSAVNLAAVHKTATCAIWGLGAISLCAVMGCRNAGAARIVGIDTNPEKFEIGKRLGCTEFLNPLEVKVEEVLKEQLDYAFDCVGQQKILETGVQCLLPWGTLVSVGLAPKGSTLEVPVGKLLTGQRITGGFFGGLQSRAGVQRMVEEYVEGKIDLDPLITKYYKLEEINEAFEALQNGKNIRGVIVYD